MGDGTTTTGDTLGFRSYGGETELHCHDFHQIVLPRSGVLELEIDGRGGAVASGRGAFIPAGVGHAFRAAGRNAFVVVDAAGPASGGIDIQSFERCAFFTIRTPVQNLLDFLTATAADGEIGSALRHHWCGLLYAALTPVGDRHDDPSRRALERAIGFMRDHLESPIAVGDIARAAGVGESRLHGLFRMRHGTTPHAMLMEMRLDAALALLAGTSLSVAEIAVRTGHGDQSSLTRRLRQSRGLTPARFRRENA